MPPPSASREGIRAGARPPFLEAPADTARRLRADAMLSGFATSRVAVLDVGTLFAEPRGGIRMIAGNGRLTFQDGGHLSETGTSLVKPLLARALADGVKIGRAHV